MNKICLEFLCPEKCDKLECDDFRTDLKYVFELIWQALKRFKIALLCTTACLVYGRVGRTVG